MYIGPQIIEVEPGSLIEVRADAGFTAYGIEEGKEDKYLLGPFNSNHRIVRAFLPKNANAIEIKTSKATCFTVISSVVQTKETPDPTKSELLVSGPVEPNINDMIKMYIRQETSNFDERLETLEESLDLELPDEIEPFSGYEVTDMVEEYEAASDDTTTAKPSEETHADDDKSTSPDDTGATSGDQQTVQPPPAGDKTSTG